MDKKAYAIRLASWAKIIEEASNCGYTKSEWCRQHGIRLRRFHYWQKKLRDYMLEHPENSIVDIAVPAVSNADSKQSFYEIELTHKEPDEPTAQLQQPLSPCLMLKFDRFQLYIGNGVSEELLSCVIRVAGNA